MMSFETALRPLSSCYLFLTWRSTGNVLRRLLPRRGKPERAVTPYRGEWTLSESQALNGVNLRHLPRYCDNRVNLREVSQHLRDTALPFSCVARRASVP